MLLKQNVSWSPIKERAFEVGSKLIENHNDVEDILFKGLIRGLSSAILRKKLEKATDEEVFLKYKSDYDILKPFILEFQMYDGLEKVREEFKSYPKFGRGIVETPKDNFKSLFE